MKILVTGGSGFIGSHTVVELIKQGYKPIIVDDFRNSNESIINQIKKITGGMPSLYKIDCCNLSDLQCVFEKENLNGIIHFAAYKAVGESMHNPIKYYNNNILSLINVLKLMSKYNVKNIVFSSSCTVYGNINNIPVKESINKTKAESPYGKTKQICEDMLADYFNSQKDKNISILRYFNPIGAHPSGLIGELPLGTPNNLVPYITQTAIGIRKELTVFGNDYPTPDGTCIRDYIHVVDLANAHIQALKKNYKNNNIFDIYNVGLGKGSSVLEVIKAFEKISSQKLNYQIGEKRLGDVSNIYSDNTKIKNELDWKPKFSLEDALKDAWNWQKNLNNGIL